MMEKKLPSVDDLIAAYAEFRDHIATAIHGEHIMEAGLFSLVVVKLFGFIFNTYKAIALLLSDRYHEQGTTLYRIMWESGANLAWIAKDPENRARQFMEFTVVEFQRYLQSQVQLTAAAYTKTSSETMASLLRQYEVIMSSQLSRFKYVDRKGRLRLRNRFSRSSLDDVVRELGSPWTLEYQLHYKLACFYTHGAPGAVLFPFLFMPENGIKAFTKVDEERTTLLALISMELMQRCLDIFSRFIGRTEDQFYEQLQERVWAGARPNREK